MSNCSNRCWLRFASAGALAVPAAVLAAPPTGDQLTASSLTATEAPIIVSVAAFEEASRSQDGGIAGFAFTSGFEPPCAVGTFIGGGASSVPQSCEWHGSNGITVPVPLSPSYSAADPFSGLQHLRFEFDSLQPQGDPDQVAQDGSRNWAFSDDLVPTPTEGPVVVSLWVRLNSGKGAMQNALIIQPQAPTQLALTTVFRFDPDGTIYAGDDDNPADGNFIIGQLPFVWEPDVWTNVRIAIDGLPDLSGPSGNCCDDQGAGNPGCDDPDCELAVCAKDPLCCNFQWDGTCATSALDLCGCKPSPATNPGRIRYFADESLLLSTERPNEGLCGGVFAGSIIEHVLIRWEGNLDDGWSVDVDDVMIEAATIEEVMEGCCSGGTCSMMTQFDCVSAGGTYLGVDSDCSGSPCAACDIPSGGLTEAEGCGADTNGGCNATPAAFDAIGFDDTISGTAWAECGTRDTDWYMIPTVLGPTTVTATLDAQFTGNVSFFEVSDCANPTLLGTGAVTATCSSGTTTTVEIDAALQVAIVVSHFSFFDGSCVGAGAGSGGNNDYRLGLVIGGDEPCEGDSNNSGAVDVEDLVNVILQWATAGPEGDVNDSSTLR